MAGRSREASGGDAAPARRPPAPASAGSWTGIGRRAGVAVVAVLAAVAAWRVVWTTVVRDDRIPFDARPGGPDGPGSAASGEPQAARDAATVRRAEAALRAEPMDADAYVALALAAERGGRNDRALRLMEIAVALWPRDIRAQTWLLARSLRLRDYAGAMARFDVITRGRPDVLDALAEATAPALRDPEAVAALAGLLNGDPPWRTRFIDIAFRLWREPDTLVALVQRLQAGPSGLSPVELRAILTRLMLAGRVDQAYLTWLRSLPGDRLASLTYLYNGRFQYPVSDLPFDWTMPAVPGASVAVSGEGADRVLTVGFLGGRLPLAPVRHDLLLPPGDYRLSGSGRTDRLRAEHGGVWRIACLDDADGALAASGPFVGSTPWRGFTLDFTVPEAGCRAQVLSFDIRGRSDAEKRASGIAAFSALGIEPR